MIPFIDLKTQYQKLKPQIQERINSVLDHGQYIMGPEVEELEKRLSDYVGTKHCISVASGTEALLISLMALGIGHGDEVITTPFTFVATAEVIALLGATPVFVDVEADTCNIDAKKIEEAITQKTKAIMPVSLYGQMADMDQINQIAQRNGNIPVIEDAAQSFGASYKDKKSCGISTLGCTSFFPSKPLGCYGDGGAVFTSDSDLARVIREIRVHGQEKRYFHTRVGVGGRMDTLQCAIVLAKLDSFDWEVQQRIEVGNRYRELLGNMPGVQLLTVREDRTCVWAQYTIQVQERDLLISKLKDKGIPTAVHYPTPLHKQPAYKDRFKISGSLSNAEKVSTRVLSLPMHPFMSWEEQKGIAGVLIEIMKDKQ